MYSCSVHYVISPKGLTWYPQPIKMHIFLRMPYAIHPASSASFCLDWGGEKQALPESCQTFEVAAARTSGLVNCVFECEYPFIDKPMVIIEHAVAIAQLLGLGSKLYPINMPRMPNKILLDSCRVFLEFAKIKQTKGRLCWQGAYHGTS